jgi:hypothetical protein
MICSTIRLYGEEFLTPRPNPKLEDHPLSAVRNLLFSIFKDTLERCDSGEEQLGGTRECGNEISVSVKCGEFLE